MKDPQAHLRALYRLHGQSGYHLVKAEYDKLIPDGVPRLDQILVNAWREGRELAGQRYDLTMQTWRDSEGNVVE